MSTASRIAKGIIWGVVSGILYYLIFAVLIPMLFSFYNIPVQGEITSTSPYFILGLILVISLDTIASLLRFPLSLPFYLASAAVALFVMGSLVGWGKITRDVYLSGEKMVVSVDASPLIAAVIGISILYAFISSLNRLKEE
ncbi:MAG: hypothetical protein ACP5I2_04805 [Fervidicoccaceae archaeon]|uniref:Uncharacterized protein n=1 Tax=Fervidicoccus fontis TaxID=683846 RepID=A0A7C2UV22_9CREN|nr:MAG: hypothetical protein C0179_02665 [Fervidicoccus sp.]HEU98163.1 hypothetical protein [Fervidicoccus fontis]